MCVCSSLRTGPTLLTLQRKLGLPSTSLHPPRRGSCRGSQRTWCVLVFGSCRRRASRADCCRCCCALAVLSVLLVLFLARESREGSPPGCLPLQVSGRTPPPWRCVWGFRERTWRGKLSITLVLLRIVPHFGTPFIINMAASCGDGFRFRR